MNRNRQDIAVASVVAGAGYLATMWVDNRLIGGRYDDLLLLGGPFSTNKKRARLIGGAIHFGNSLAVGTVYTVFVHDRLKGPGWFRGASFAMVENAVLYPLTLLESHHPSIKNGDIDSFLTVRGFLQSLPRHLAFGALLGGLTRPKG